MFRLISVNPTGMFSYGLHGDIMLHEMGSVLLEGKNYDRNGNSNGAGKTSFFHAITHILYGKNPSEEGADTVVNEFLGKYFGQVVFLDKNNRKWRVTDVRKWRKADKYPQEKLSKDFVVEPSEIHNSGLRLSGTDVYLEAWDESAGLWTDERSSNREVGDARLDLKATRKKIVDILGIDYDQFMSVAYLAQQQTLKFISGTHKERMQVIAELSDLKAWDARTLAIRDDLSNLESEKSRLESKMDGLGQIAFVKPDNYQKQLLQSSIDNFLLQIADCDNKLGKIVVDQSNWEVSRNVLATSLKRCAEQMADEELMQRQEHEALDTLALEYARDCEKARSAPRPFDIARLETEISECNGQIIARRFDLEQLMVGSGKCTKCRMTVTMDHILRQRELLTIEMDSLKEKINTNKNILEKIISEWEGAVLKNLDQITIDYNFSRGPIIEMLNTSKQSQEEIKAMMYSCKLAEEKLGPAPKAQSFGVEQQRLALLAQKSSKDMELKNWEASLKRYEDYSTIVSATKANILAADHEIKHLRVLERLFGDKGIKAFKLDAILAILNQSLDKYIDIISDGSVKVWVSQYREKADGELATDLQIVVREGHKHEVPFALYSGGERQQITLAFIGAFWHLASMCGAGVNIMCLDEIFGPLDDINTNNVFNYLDYMRTNGKSSLFIVTHNENIKHQVKFDQVWTVVKKNHMSELKTGVV